MYIGVIGAGGAAAAATYVLDETRPEATITVLEKSGGVCGRAATRRRGPITYDYGANYLKDEDERVAEQFEQLLAGGRLVVGLLVADVVGASVSALGRIAGG